MKDSPSAWEQECCACIKAYLASRLPLVAPLEDSTALLTSGILDSISVVLLANHLAERYQVGIQAEDFCVANFQDIPSIASMLGRKLST